MDRLWRSCLLLIVVAFGWQYLCIAWNMPANNDNDAAYYFGMARHIVRTGRFEEPIVWHFLNWSPSLVHRPFDYWQGLTSLLLIPPMWLFGASERVAFTTMALLSVLSLLLFWRLITAAIPIRHRLLQAAAIIAFGFSPAMEMYRFDTESVVPVQILLLASLCALGRGRYVLASLLAFPMTLARADASLMCAMICLQAFLVAKRNHRSFPWKAVLAPVTLVGALVVVNWTVHGSPTPPGAAKALTMQNYDDLYVAPPRRPAYSRDLKERWSWHELHERTWVAFDAMRTVPFLPQQRFWLPAILMGFGYVLRRAPAWRFVWILLFTHAIVVSWLSPLVFAHHRTLHPLTPLVVLAAISLLDVLLDDVVRWCARSGRGVLAGCVAPVAAFALLIQDTEPYHQHRLPACASLHATLHEVDGRLEGLAVMAVRPWSIIASTRSPAVAMPTNGEAAMLAVVDRYRVDWLVLDQECADGASEFCRSVVEGTRSNLGPHTLVKLPDTGSVHIFRIRREQSS